uniref:Uncharacterized protein n=1 Tax=Rhizophagus irregularis (strain DAOM 181602 / DAOM 197198 / MUCL 43194) TaxID=747089 RepID=U9U2T6_RHIID
METAKFFVLFHWILSISCQTCHYKPFSYLSYFTNVKNFLNNKGVALKKCLQY